MSTLVAQNISNGTVSTSSANVINGSAKAWVNFNGTGTVAIRSSYNVTSITDSGAGDYIVNFTNAFVDTNYATVSSSGRNGTGSGGYLSLVSDKTAQTQAAVQIYTINTSGVPTDAPYVTVSCFR
jgi:hypothetical protein